jgi:hypothetical protein
LANTTYCTATGMVSTGTAGAKAVAKTAIT